jgi:hypothetical protein
MLGSGRARPLAQRRRRVPALRCTRKPPLAGGACRVGSGRSRSRQGPQASLLGFVSETNETTSGFGCRSSTAPAPSSTSPPERKAARAGVATMAAVGEWQPSWEIVSLGDWLRGALNVPGVTQAVPCDTCTEAPGGTELTTTSCSVPPTIVAQAGGRRAELEALQGRPNGTTAGLGVVGDRFRPVRQLRASRAPRREPLRLVPALRSRAAQRGRPRAAVEP